VRRKCRGAPRVPQCAESAAVGRGRRSAPRVPQCAASAPVRRGCRSAPRVRRCAEGAATSHFFLTIAHCRRDFWKYQAKFERRGRNSAQPNCGGVLRSKTPGGRCGGATPRREGSVTQPLVPSGEAAFQSKWLGGAGGRLPPPNIPDSQTLPRFQENAELPNHANPTNH
jgi:hypothetical protein